MDNLTHSLTGALAAKVLEVTRPNDSDDLRDRRSAFWLLVVSANLPDLDVVLGMFSDPIFAMQHHRGLTHSILFAPVFALLPASLFYFWKKLKPFKTAWLLALLGTLVHIFFDVITAYGTQIFSPFSPARHALDWMFIIDPFFTGILVLPLLLAKFWTKPRRKLILGGVAFVAFYLGAEMVNHNLAKQRMATALQQSGISATNISALPQPFNIFRWMGIARTPSGVAQAYFSNLQTDELSVMVYENAEDEFARRARQTPESRWYLQFARYPWIHMEEREGRNVVEIRDLQFMIDKGITQALGFPERSLPFILRYSFSLNGNPLETEFNNESLPQQSYSK